MRVREDAKENLQRSVFERERERERGLTEECVCERGLIGECVCACVNVRER